MPVPLTLVIFGATGDLTARKLAPSLVRLAGKGRLPEELKIVGAARTPLTDDAFRDRLAAAVREFAKSDWDEAKWRTFAPRLSYVAADAAKPGGLDGLTAWLKKAEGETGGRRLFYLAVGPQLVADIARGLGAEGLNRQEGENWTRLIIEKPFGRDLESARALNRVLREVFSEDQIYRIDHYLGKDTVQNVLVFRFANTLFEPVWNNNFIDHVQITACETVKVEGLKDSEVWHAEHSPAPAVECVEARFAQYVESLFFGIRCGHANSSDLALGEALGQLIAHILLEPPDDQALFAKILLRVVLRVRYCRRIQHVHQTCKAFRSAIVRRGGQQNQRVRAG